MKEAMAIEADRMRGAFIREEDRRTEMTVVRNEFERKGSLLQHKTHSLC
jgi:zinc protease